MKSYPSSAPNLCALLLPIKKVQGKLAPKRGLNDMTLLTASLCNWPLVDQIRERAKRHGFYGMR